MVSKSQSLQSSAYLLKNAMDSCLFLLSDTARLLSCGIRGVCSTASIASIQSLRSCSDSAEN